MTPQGRELKIVVWARLFLPPNGGVAGIRCPDFDSILPLSSGAAVLGQADPLRGPSMKNEIVRLLMEHRGTLFAFIFASVRDYDAAEEVLQDVSVVVCENSDSFELGTNFGAWAREIARRRILAYYRMSKRFPCPLSDDELRNLQAGFDDVDDVTARLRMASLMKCLDSLKPFAKHLIHLRYTGRFSLGEIGEQVGRQPESVRKALYRTRRVLRECIERRIRTGDEAA